LKLANEQVDSTKKIIIVTSEEFHEGIVGLIAGRLGEKHYKPTVVLTIKPQEGIAVGSLRGPDYFDIVNMLKVADGYLERYGGHKQAGGLTVKLENLDTVCKIFEDYANSNIGDNIQRIVEVDTKIYDNEINVNSLEKIHLLAPFGEGNQEPIFLIDKVNIGNIEKVGKTGNGHMKMHGNKNGQKFQIMLRGKGGEIDGIDKNTSKKIIGKVKRDDYNGGFFIDGNNIIDED
ncbi:MAG: DHHA1 domain-containing protein, partial [Candidatus Absconditabacteria bacterium]